MPLRKQSFTRQPVILVHGMWMTGIEMSVLGWRLKKAGFTPTRFSYSSLNKSPKENSERLARFIQVKRLDNPHIIGHSLGGIVAMHLFANCHFSSLGRVVFMGTPARGSVTAKRMNDHQVLRLLLGRSVEEGLLGDAPPWQGQRQLGIIAGTDCLIGVGRLLGYYKGPGDGTVAIEETVVPKATDYFSMRTNHLSMLFSHRVAEKVIQFLRTGSFH